MTARPREPQSQHCITLYLHGYICLVYYTSLWHTVWYCDSKLHAHVLLQLEDAPFMLQYCHHYTREIWRSGKVLRLCPYGWMDALWKGRRKWAQALSVLLALLLGDDTTAQTHLGGYCKKAWVIKVKDFGRQWISHTQTLDFLTFRTLRNRISVSHKLLTCAFIQAEQMD